MKEIIGIDLGSSNTRIYSSLLNEVVFSEPSSLALDVYSGKIKELGFLSKKIQGRTPYNIEVVGPIKNGQIYDINIATEFLKKILQEQKVNKAFRGMSLVFSCPSECSNVSQQALIDIGKRLQAKEIFIESEAKLSALGAGENLNSPGAILVCNIGSGTTDIACISLGEIVNCSTTYIAGDSFDEAIRRCLIQEQHIQVGNQTCENLKRKIGTLSSGSDNKISEVKGKDTITSLPTSALITSSLIKKTIMPLCKHIALKISDVILNLSSELSSDLVTNGLILTGGGALLNGIKEFLSNTLSIPVKIPKDPENATINGLKNFIKNLLTK